MHCRQKPRFVGSLWPGLLSVAWIVQSLLVSANTLCDLEPGGRGTFHRVPVCWAKSGTEWNRSLPWGKSVGRDALDRVPVCWEIRDRVESVPTSFMEGQTLSADTNRLQYALIVTGEELLRGVYADTHTAFITRTLRPVGGQCAVSLVVDDRPEDLKTALDFALKRVRLVIITGGLGPSVNDITASTLAEFTGVTLREHPDVLAEMQRRFSQSADKLRPNLRRQCLVPDRGTYMRNPNGTAVGLVFEPGHYVIIALPGPPRELQPMVREAVLPYLEGRYGTQPQRCSLTLRFVGIGQSQIDQTLRDESLVPGDVVVSTLFEGGRVDFSFSLPVDSPPNRARLNELAGRVRQHLGSYIYAEGDVTLEEKVLDRLQRRSASLVLVEMASGARLMTSLRTAAIASAVVKGGYVAATEEQMRLLLGIAADRWASLSTDAERIATLAGEARQRSGAQWAIVVGAASSSQGQPNSVLVGSGNGSGCWETEHLPAQADGELGQMNLVTQVLAWVDRQLELQ